MICDMPGAFVICSIIALLCAGIVIGMGLSEASREGPEEW